MVVRGRGVLPHEHQVERPGSDQQDQDPAQGIGTPAVQCPQGQRPCDVELLLNGQGPEVQQGLDRGRVVEVPRLTPEHHVREEQAGRQQVLAQRLQIQWCHPPPAHRKGGQQHQNQGREDPAHPARVEVPKAEASVAQLRQDDRGDQVPGNDEEDVNANEPGPERVGHGVVCHDRDDRDGAQAIDVRTVVGGK